MSRFSKVSSTFLPICKIKVSKNDTFLIDFKNLDQDSSEGSLEAEGEEGQQAAPAMPAGLSGLMPLMPAGLSGLTKFNLNMVIRNPNGQIRCTFCSLVSTNISSARQHVIRMHLVPERYQCKLCGLVIKHKSDFCNHIIKRHKLSGAKNVVGIYATRLE